MPLYEYECDACGVRFERQQSITAAPLQDCPECGGAVHRLIHPVGVIFKGKGFYVTDNRKAKSSTRVPTTKEDKPASTTKDEKSTKPERLETASAKSSTD